MNPPYEQLRLFNLFNNARTPNNNTQDYLEDLYHILSTYDAHKSNKSKNEEKTYKKSHKYGRMLLTSFIYGFKMYYRDEQKEVLHYLTPLEIITFYAGLCEATKRDKMRRNLPKEPVEFVKSLVEYTHRKYQLGRIKSSYKKGEEKYRKIIERTYPSHSGEMIKRLNIIKNKDKGKLKEFYESIGDISRARCIGICNIYKEYNPTKKEIIDIFMKKIEYKVQSNPPFPPKNPEQKETEKKHKS